MRNRSGTIRRLSAAGSLSAAALMLVSNSAGGSTITVTATNLRSDEGVVRACMTTNPERFPKCRGDANSYSVVVPAGKTVTFRFKGVTPGRYAIAMLHDENNNGKADRAMMMMPTEGYGFSRDAKVRMGPPKFKSAAFDVGPADQAQTITMRYML